MQPELATQIPELIEQTQEFLSEVDLQSIGLILVGLAFSKKVRKQIHQRDGNQSVWSGKTEDLECAHISHNKDSEEYDDPSNGRLLTTAEHMWDHINRHGTEQLGLTESQNDWAIYQLWKRFWGIK